MSTQSAPATISVDGWRASSSRAEAIGDWGKSSGIGVAAAVAWISFGWSCLWWQDLGDSSRTYALGIAAFVVAAVALFGTLSAAFLGPAGPALRGRAPWLAVLGLFLTVWALATAKFALPPFPIVSPPAG